MSELTPIQKVNEKHLRFGKIQARGTFYFVPVSYQTSPLTIQTPALITPTGIQAQEARNFLDLELDVATNAEHQTLYDVFKAIDDRCIEESVANMDKWFKGDVDEQFIEEQFKSPITAGWGNEPSEMRVELVAENPEDIVDSEGNVISPQDVTSLSAVKVTLQLLGVWVSKDFLGCHWRALSIIANLDHESKGRRRASSPRRAASPLPPVTTRGGGRTRAKQAEPSDNDDAQRSSKSSRQQPASSTKSKAQPQPEERKREPSESKERDNSKSRQTSKPQQPSEEPVDADAASRRARIENMLARFKKPEEEPRRESDDDSNDDDHYHRRRRSSSRSRSSSASPSPKRESRHHSPPSKSSHKSSSTRHYSSDDDDRRRSSYSDDDSY